MVRISRGGRQRDGRLVWSDLLRPCRHRPSRRLVVLGERRPGHVLLYVPAACGGVRRVGLEELVVVSDLEWVRSSVEAYAADPWRIGAVAVVLWLLAVGTAALWFLTARVTKWWKSPRKPKPAAVPPALTRDERLQELRRQYDETIETINSLPLAEIERRGAREEQHRKFMWKVHEILK